MSETLEQLEWIRERLIPLRLEWTEDAVVEAGAEAYRRFPESETVGLALLDYSMLPRESLDIAIKEASARRPASVALEFGPQAQETGSESTPCPPFGQSP